MDRVLTCQLPGLASWGPVCAKLLALDISVPGGPEQGGLQS